MSSEFGCAVLSQLQKSLSAPNENLSRQESHDAERGFHISRKLDLDFIKSRPNPSFIFEKKKGKKMPLLPAPPERIHPRILSCNRFGGVGPGFVGVTKVQSVFVDEGEEIGGEEAVLNS